jgi:hypothetical protein
MEESASVMPTTYYAPPPRDARFLSCTVILYGFYAVIYTTFWLT